MRIQVTVLCIVYNHERYIRQCLDSLVNQKTNFNYEIIVHDDASTDDSASIIREYANMYPDLIVPIIQQENQYSKGISPAAKHMLPISKGKYIALCEGDDFWTDSDKLQAQFDIMDAHPDYSLCCHSAYYAKENGTLITNRYFAPYNESRIIPMEDVLNRWLVATNSLFYRKSFLEQDNYVVPFKGDCPSGDLALIVFFGLKGKIYYINKLMSAYRYVSVGSLGWTHRGNPESTRIAKMKLIDMLDRIDVYSEYKYHSEIAAFKKKLTFEIYLAKGDIKNAKAMHDYYKKLKWTVKMHLYLSHYFPGMAIKLTQIKKKIQNHD